MQSERAKHGQYATTAILLLVSLIIASLGAIATPTLSRAATPAAGLIVVSPATAKPGQTVVITGSRFQPSEPVVLQLSPATTTAAAAGVRNLGAVQTATNGVFRFTYTVPVDIPAGSYLLRGTGLISHISGYARLIVSVLTATVEARPASVTPGADIRVSGTGFLPGEVVTITVINPSGSAAFTLGQAHVDAAGAFASAALRMPFGVAAGRQNIVVTGQRSNRQASTSVTVGVQAATLQVTPSVVKPGTRLTVTGAHFQPHEAVSIDLVTLNGTIHLGSSRTTATGSFGVGGLPVPRSAPSGTFSVVATGATSHLSATAQIRVVAPATSLLLSKPTVTPGAAITVTGHGFIAGETVSVQIMNSLVRIVVATTVANSGGSFSLGSVVVPTFLPAGTYSVTASGQTSGRAATAPLTVQRQHAVAPTLSVIGVAPVAGAYPASPGSLLQVAGSNFPAGSPVTLALRGPTTIALATVTANGSGVFGPLGLTIPASTPAGTYTLQATVGGRLLASTQAVRVATLAPHITLSASSLTPGQVVNLQGSGFAPNEQVVLALGGVALVTVPSSAVTNASGSFSVSFTVPQTVSSGTNVLTATGTSSRATATLQAAVSLPVASRWYFVNGDTTNGRTTTISILNPQNVITTVKMTFLYQAAPEQQYTETVPAHTLAVVDLGLIAGAGREIATILQADHQISAETTVNYPGGSSSSAIGATGPATRWYLAEGYTNRGFSETLHVMNPNNAYTTVDVQFLPFNNMPARETRFVMLPNSIIDVDAGQYMPGLSISTIVSSDKPIVVERSMHFGTGGLGAHDKIGVTSLSTIWMFAQSQATSDQQTFFTILNPNQSASAAVTATFFNSVGQPVGARTIVVDPLHRGNIKLNDVVPNATVATVVTSNVPVVVESPSYLGPADLTQARSGSVVVGRNGGGLSWAFPGGSTLNGGQTMMYLFNPGLQTAQVKATFYTDAGAVVTQTVAVTPNSDLTLNVASVPGMPVARFGAVLQSTNGEPFIAQQSVQNGTAPSYTTSEGVAQ